MKNTLTDLHNHLFETLEGLKDPDNPMDIERAKAVSTVAQTLIDAAKVELKFMELAGQEEHSQFFNRRRLPPPANGTSK